MKQYLHLSFCIAAFFAVTLSGCDQGGSVQSNEVKFRLTAEPSSFNPQTAESNDDRIILDYMFQTLIGYDFENMKLVPILAEDLGNTEKGEGGKVKLHYKIRPEAKWDNGTSVEGKDILFSLKVLKCPGVNNEHLKPYFENIEDLIVSPSNPKEITIIFKSEYANIKTIFTDLHIIPQYIYDAKNVLAAYSLADFNQADFGKKADIKQFAEDFNQPVYGREPSKIQGSGAYKFGKWETAQQVVLERKPDWWGDAVKTDIEYFKAYPQKISFKIIPDAGTALNALKAGEIDVMTQIPTRDYKEDLLKSSDFNAKYDLSTPNALTWSYLGFNMKTEKFADKKVREALTHLMNVDAFIETAFSGMALRVNSPIHPAQKKIYNTELPMQAFDVEKAKQLLAEAGWSDKNRDGIVEKDLNGKATPMKIELAISTSKAVEALGLIFKEGCRQAGVEVTLNAMPMEKLIEKFIKPHQFDMYCGVWSAPLDYGDPKQIWHTESIEGGSNFISFSNPQVDSLIEGIRAETNADELIKKYKVFQKLITEEYPYIFLATAQNKIAVSKKFKHIETSSKVPGLWLGGLGN